MKLLEKENALTTQVVSKALNVPEVTASRNLRKLVKLGKLTVLGRGRGVHYVAKVGATLQEITILKEKLDFFRPFPPEIIKNIEQALIGKFVHATNSIEGSQLTLRETDLVLAGATIKGKRNEIQDVINQKNALELIKVFLKKDEEMSEQFIQNLQREVTANVGDVFLHGKYRDQDVSIFGTDKIFPSPFEVQELMQKMVEKINFMLRKKHHPALVAAYAHYHLTAIHPFFDGNGRTARLLMNAILLKYHFPLTVIELNKRQDYYEALQKADAGMYEIFQAFIFGAIRKNLGLYLIVLDN